MPEVRTEEAPTLRELGAVIATDPGEETIVEALRSAMKEKSGLASDASATGAVLEGATGAVPAEPAAPAGAVPLQQRDATTGRFVEGPQEKAPGKELGEKVSAQATDEKDGEKPPEPLEPPAAWNVADQERFRKLAPGDQKFLLEKVTTVKNELPENLVEVDRLLAPRREEWARLGQKPEAALSQLLTISDFAAARPLEFINWFVTQRGIDPAHLTATPARQAQDESALDKITADDPINNDPAFKALRDEILRLKKAVGEVSSITREQSEAVIRNDREAARQSLTEFKSEKDATGNPKHPYYEEVRHLMSTFIDPRLGEKGAKNLEEAYAMACRAHPEVYQKIAAAEAAKKERERRREEQDKAGKAKTAAASVSGAAARAAPAAPTGDLRADLAAEFKSRGLYGSAAI